MRLIDADELEKVMTEDWFLEILAAQETKSAIKKDIENCIDSVPLAYDVEKVAEELEEWSFETEIVIPTSDDYEDTVNRKIICTGNAIEIVRKGGLK